tara:strand:+ start:63 stop:836 length:774 start_codon:yes stop_codon:yes gene_type:complete
MLENNQYKSVFLSDIHLGFSGCQSDKLDTFLGNLKCKELYLVGDIIDFWAMEDNFYWPDSHMKILNRIIELKEQGTEVTYISGNHDDPLREDQILEELYNRGEPYHTIINQLDRLNHREKYDFISKKHGKILLIHGDQYDSVTTNAKWISKFGGLIYDGLIYLNRPLSKRLKALTKRLVDGASGFHRKVKNECQKGGYAGLMCGHNHRPEIKKFENHFYLNTGDWIESCSAIVELTNGSIQLIKMNNDNTIMKVKDL